METENIVAGGQVIQINFGVTFVVVEGFSLIGDQTLEWRLRLDKEFSVRKLQNNAPQREEIDVCERKLSGAETLIRCCGQDVATFNIGKDGLLVTFADGTNLQLDWAEDELSCANLYATASEALGEPQLICMMTFPDDL